MEDARQPWPLRDYQVLKELGRGSKSITILARREGSRLDVVVKYLFREGFSGPGVMERVRHDAEALCLVTEPRLARIYACRVGERGIAAIGEFVAGQNLQDVLRAVGNLGLSSALYVALECLRGIDALHQIGVVHGNLHPKSVMILPEGDIKLVGATLRGDTPDVRVDEKDTHSIWLLLVKCLTGQGDPEISGEDLNNRLGPDEDAAAVASLLCITRWALRKNRGERPPTPTTLIDLLVEWGEETLGARWEERGRGALAGAARSANRPVDTTDQSPRVWPVFAGVAALSVLVGATIVASGGEDGPDLPIAARPPVVVLGDGRSMIPSARVKKVETPSLASSVSPRTESPSNELPSVVVKTKAPQPTASEKLGSIPPSAPQSAKPSVQSGLVQTVSVQEFYSSSQQAVTSVIAVTAKSTEPFEINISYYDTSSGGSLSMPGRQDGDAWTVPLFGSRTYTVTSSHKFPNSVCAFGVRAVASSAPLEDDGYRKLLRRAGRCEPDGGTAS
ncbi:serine/threonine protein kinase [Streptomyces sp. 1222.5]|uniref:serine/threonine protein kinase n=1 Tax=Streptomyces sp. 1222.5 TaxID=1881026 RepID=UPI003EBDFD3D